MDISFVSVLETNIKAKPPTRPRQLQLSRHTVIVGANGEGKSRIQHGLTLALSGVVEDYLGRLTSSLPADLMFMAPAGEDYIWAKATFSGGALNGQCTEYRCNKGKKADPAGGVPGAAASARSPLILEDVVTKLRQKPEAVRQFLLPYVVSAISEKDIRSRLASQYTDAGAPNAGVVPTNLDALLKAIDDAKDTAKREKQRGTGISDYLATSTAEDGPPPLDSDLKYARDMLNECNTRVEAAAHAEGGAVERQRLSAELADLQAKHQWMAANIDTMCPAPAPLPEGDRAMISLLGAAKVAGATVRGSGLNNCIACGSPVTPAGLQQWSGVVDSQLAAIETRTAGHRLAATNRATAEEAKLRLGSRLAEVSTQLQRIGNITPNPLGGMSLVDARTLQAEAQATFSQLEARRARHDQGQKAKTDAVSAGQAATWWVAYAEALAAVANELLVKGRDQFVARVQKYLPPTFRFHLLLQDGNREVCRFGLERDGFVEMSPSGAEESAIWLAIGAVILDSLPDPMPYACLVVPDERGWKGDTLAAVMAALASCPYQIVVFSTVPPKGKPKGWGVLDLAEFTEKKKKGKDDEGEADHQNGAGADADA